MNVFWDFASNIVFAWSMSLKTYSHGVTVPTADLCIVTARKQSLGEIMFSQASVCSQGVGNIKIHPWVGGYFLRPNMGPGYTTPPDMWSEGTLCPTTYIWWSSLKAYSNMLIWGPTPCPPPRHWYWHLVVATEIHTVGRQAVHILLECCLVKRYF